MRSTPVDASTVAFIGLGLTLAGMWGNLRVALKSVQKDTTAIQKQLNGPLAKTMQRHAEHLSELQSAHDQLRHLSNHVAQIETKVEKLQSKP
jgi:uncharacterized protein YoxC